ncbi:putative lipid II flippase FtsW [candidate division WWE3 bacterium]|nr:putative lipid II flippase FtsW [candidate division WWE3 bacterium]
MPIKNKKKPASVARTKSRLRLNYDDVPVIDYVLAGVIVLLTLFGVVMVYNTSIILAFEQFGDKYWFLKNQAMWAILGLTGGLFTSMIDYRVWRKFAFPLVVITIVMLILVLVPGLSNEVYGAKQRLIIPGGLPFLKHIFIQPSEVAKLTLIMYLGSLLAKYNEQKKHEFPHAQFWIITSIILGLTAIEPDLGNAILIMGGAFAVYFVSGAPLLYILSLVAVGGLAALGYAFSSEYRRQRLFTFLDPNNDPQGVSYHVTQILIALGSGGFFGLGLGNSRQKHQYIPEVPTDSIFAIIGEELGFVGACLVISALIFIIWRGIKIAFACEDTFGRLLAIGIITNIALQTVVNLGGMVGIMPLTGVPLPFISYGGSSLTLMLVSIGILLNISKSTTVRSVKSQK